MAADTLTDTSGAAQCDLDQSAQAGPTHPKRTKHGSPGHLRATSQPGCHQSVSRGGWTSRNPLLSTAPGAGLELGRASGEEPGFWFLSHCQSLPQGGKQNAVPGDISLCSFPREGSWSAGWLAAVTAPSAPTWARGGTGSLPWHRAACRAWPDGAAGSCVCPYPHASLLAKW